MFWLICILCNFGNNLVVLVVFCENYQDIFCVNKIVDFDLVIQCLINYDMVVDGVEIYGMMCGMLCGGMLLSEQ